MAALEQNVTTQQKYFGVPAQPHRGMDCHRKVLFKTTPPGSPLMTSFFEGLTTTIYDVTRRAVLKIDLEFGRATLVAARLLNRHK